MRKTLIVPILLLAVLALVGAGCGEKEAEKGVVSPGEEEKVEEEKVEEETESLADVLAKAKGVVSYKYDAVITTPDQAPITVKFWLKGYKLRWEGSYEGQSVVFLMDQSTQIAYTYIPAQGIAMKMDFSKAKETAGETPTEQAESVMDYNPVTLDTEVLDGKTCLVVEYSSQTGEVKMWIWTKYGLPIRIETTTAEGKAVAEIKNIDFGSIPDSMFELPAGVQPMELPFLGF